MSAPARKNTLHQMSLGAAKLRTSAPFGVKFKNWMVNEGKGEEE